MEYAERRRKLRLLEQILNIKDTEKNTFQQQATRSYKTVKNLKSITNEAKRQFKDKALADFRPFKTFFYFRDLLLFTYFFSLVYFILGRRTDVHLYGPQIYVINNDDNSNSNITIFIFESKINTL